MNTKKKQEVVGKEKEGVVWLVYFGLFYCISLFGDVLAQLHINASTSSFLTVFGYNLLTRKLIYGILWFLRPIGSALFLMNYLNEKIDYFKNRTLINIILLTVIVLILIKMFFYADPLNFMQFYVDQNTITQ